MVYHGITRGVIIERPRASRAADPNQARHGQHIPRRCGQAYPEGRIQEEEKAR
jgi:hypothetical protein